MPGLHKLAGVDINNIASVMDVDAFVAPATIAKTAWCHFVDRFNDTNLTQLQNHTPDHDFTSGGWTTTASPQIINNRLTGTSEGDPTIDPGVADVFAAYQATPAPSSTANRQKIILNYTSTTANWQCYGKYDNATNMTLYIYEDNGGLTIRATDPFLVADLTTFNWIVASTSGDTIATAWYDDTLTKKAECSYTVASRFNKTATGINPEYSGRQLEDFRVSNRNITSFPA
jgi:hypothetical protein